MPRKLALIFTLTAWLLATGTQWDAIQTIAWARMFIENVQSMPVDEALTRTFSPEGRCFLCNAVSAAKNEPDEHGSPIPEFPTKPAAKVLLAFEAIPQWVDSLRIDSRPAWMSRDHLLVSIARAAPPLPPPRV